MIKAIPKITRILIIAGMAVLNNAHANLVSTVTIDFEAGDTHQFDNFGNPQLFEDFPLLSAVFDNGFYLEDGVKHTAIAFGGGEPSIPSTGSHVHGFTSATGNVTRRSQVADDSGGALFELNNGGAFALQAWESEFSGDDVTVRGYKPDGETFDLVLDNTIYGDRLVNPDFLDLDSRFGNIVLVEYFYTSAGRGVAGASGVDFLLDNVVLAAPVPLPTSFFLFLSGLFGMVSFIGKKKPLMDA